MMDPQFFQRLDFTPEQVQGYLASAEENLEIAKATPIPHVIFKFSYDALLKIGIMLLAKQGYKIRSVPGHHVKILEFLCKQLGLEDKLDFIDQMRSKRNNDLYGGIVHFGGKELEDLLAITEEMLKKTKSKK